MAEMHSPVSYSPDALAGAGWPRSTRLCRIVQMHSSVPNDPNALVSLLDPEFLQKMSPFPDEILANILSRLPVKCLLRSRCASKSWLALISTSYFVKLHLNRSVQTKSNLDLLLWDGDTYRVDFDSLDDTVFQPIDVDNHPLRCYKNYETLWGSCDGLLCMSNPIGDVILWNPSTRKSINLPYTPTEFSSEKKVLENTRRERVYQLGYDNINGDYKVVRLVVLYGSQFKDFEVKVYSLKSNSWHKSENCLHCPDFNRTGNSIAGGAMHWISDVISDSKKESSIVAFDLGTEKYRVIPPPPEFFGLDSSLYLDNLEGCLSLSYQYQSMSVDVFLLKEYGGKSEYWSKFVTISPTIPFTSVYTVKPIAYSKCGKKVLLDLDFEILVWYHLEHDSLEEIWVDGMKKFLDVLTCVESLVSVDVAADVTNSNAKKKLHKKEDNNIFWVLQEQLLIKGVQFGAIIPIRLVRYNLEQESVEEIMIHGMDLFIQVLTFVESLSSSVDVAAAVTNANAKRIFMKKRIIICHSSDKLR
ncbi:F-box protein CPR1-like [Impatiens glandulifera]|uniref:F-box protein CPR1-like n=1 Tax=Impatiens glandulifera TaxID=253017 RepID=UPI001FB16ECF|nr:F-box protein CPR1-like [Impatiens glandulifera]